MAFKNGGGRPRGARNKLSQRVFDDILADWQQHGAVAIRQMRMEDPGAYVRVVVSTLPKEFLVEAVHSDLDDDQLDDLIDHMKARLLEQRAAAATVIEPPKRIEKVRNNGRDAGTDRGGTKET
jgi:hypothetical protein